MRVTLTLSTAWSLNRSRGCDRSQLGDTSAEEQCQLGCVGPAAHRRGVLLCCLRSVQGLRSWIRASGLSRLCRWIHSRRSLPFHGSSSPVDSGPRSYLHGSCRGLRRIPDRHIARDRPLFSSGQPLRLRTHACYVALGWISRAACSLLDVLGSFP